MVQIVYVVEINPQNKKLNLNLEDKRFGILF